MMHRQLVAGITEMKSRLFRNFKSGATLECR
ncbi:Protein of unknown function [Pyronema omphalodes CBS 100304]|uniref:Uncharacterized protein n=1 Tax=Pyronema omphalodes (strain CBS 100304) TaxID=1076935 RepID=U4L6U8_PYROM|nr:Protein of unknown function [Pyronema omphalodes CBS 100304]